MYTWGITSDMPFFRYFYTHLVNCVSEQQPVDMTKIITNDAPTKRSNAKHLVEY